MLFHEHAKMGIYKQPFNMNRIYLIDLTPHGPRIICFLKFIYTKEITRGLSA